MKLNSNLAARERNHAIQPGRASSPLPAAECDKMPALPANSRRRARRDAPCLRLISLRSLGCFAAIVISLLFAATAAHAQVNSGSNGSDGAFNPTTNIVINMADHPDGIYQYIAVNIPAGVSVLYLAA